MAGKAEGLRSTVGIRRNVLTAYEQQPKHREPDDLYHQHHRDFGPEPRLRADWYGWI